jgi:lysozyme
VSAQAKSRAPVVGGAVAAIALAAAFIAPWEGRELAPYKDIVGVWTVCYGHTRDVQAKRYTPQECDALLRQDAARHLIGAAQCIKRPLDANEWVALGSWTFNVGIGAACNSTLVRKINAGASANDWCRELLKWDRAGGKKVRGLTRRREAEYRECVK